MKIPADTARAWSGYVERIEVGRHAALHITGPSAVDELILNHGAEVHDPDGKLAVIVAIRLARGVSLGDVSIYTRTRECVVRLTESGQIEIVED